MKSRVCIAVSSSPNPSCVYIRLCKHGKRFLLLRYKCLYYYLFIVKIITLCFKVPAKVNASDAAVREQTYYLETFDRQILSKALTLAHSFARQNDRHSTRPFKIRDFKDCILKNPDLQSVFLASTQSTF